MRPAICALLLAGCSSGVPSGAADLAGRTDAAICPASACAPACAELVDAATCGARDDCHAVYQPGNACGCAALGCCTFFSVCASGAPYCKSDRLTCRAAPPLCEGPYVVAYANGCYEGCVLATACP